MALAAMMLVTVADVVLRAVANLPIRGTLEIVELLLACAFFLALPASFLRDEHIVVDIVDGVAGRWVPLLKRIALARLNGTEPSIFSAFAQPSSAA